jgi:hypothetical protein
MIHINLHHVKTSGHVIRKKDILIIIQYYNIIHETYCMIPNDHIHIKRSMYIRTEMTKEICVKYFVNGEIPIEVQMVLFELNFLWLSVCLLS